MRNKLEHILLSLLLGLSVLLGISFWLNTTFGFNLFYKEHWDTLAQLQASHTPISYGFYVSIVIAILIFMIGIYVICRPITQKTQKKTPVQTNQNITQIKPIEEKIDDISAPIPSIPLTRPPRLNLPSNMSQIAEKRHQEQTQQQQAVLQTQSQQNQYNTTLSQIFSDNGYVVKQNPVISGFTPNLFAIGTGEILWIGGVDTNPKTIQNAIEKLSSVFQQTLEDIQINIMAFILDTSNQYQSTDTIMVFKSADELSKFLNENPVDQITEENQDNFDAYSEYIDTIIQYVKNI